MINKQVIDYLLSTSGKVPEGSTWFSIGEKFGIQAPDQERAKTEPAYNYKSIGRRTQQVWQNYLTAQDKLRLNKQIFDGEGNLLWETFKFHPQEVDPINSDDFEVEKITTNPYGGAWMKLKKKENFHTEEHLDKLVKILSETITPTEYPSLDVHENSHGLFVYGADKHIGALTKQDSIYSNRYNKEEIMKRIVDFTLQNILKTVGIFGILESLFIMDFGDALDGFNQKTTGGLRGTSVHTLPQQLNNRDQHDFYVEVHKALFDQIVHLEIAKDIYFVATSNSNHGGDFEYGAMRHLEEYLNIKYPFIKTKINYFPLNHFFYGDHCIIFGHGKDDEDMRNGMPLNLTDKVENFLNDYIKVNDLGKYNVTFVSGDLHQSSENYGKALRYKKVLSQYGSSKWMHTNFGSGSPGLSYELYSKTSKGIWKMDDFFDIESESNTGINFDD